MKKIIIILSLTVIIAILVISLLSIGSNKKNLGVALQWNKFEKPTNTATTASSTAAAQRVALNYDRQFLLVVNTGTSTAWMWLNTSTDSVAVNKSIPLAPMTTTTPNYANSSYQIDGDNLYFGPIQFIANDYTTLFIIEK